LADPFALVDLHCVELLQGQPPCFLSNRWKGTLQQYVGRLHRLHENKSEVQVYDYADVSVPMLARMYKKRLAGYAAFGYAIAVGSKADDLSAT
jgi:hypothetical protein